MDEVKLIAAIDAYAETAHGADSDGGELSNQRSLALRAYSGENLEPAPEGRSQVVDRTIFESVQWIMPSLMRIFGGGDSGTIVEFDPEGPDDEDKAEQESMVLNALITGKNDWEKTIRTWMQDALLTKNAYILATMDEKVRTETQRYEAQREEQLAMLLKDDPEIVGQEQYDDPDDEGQVVDPFTGQPVQDEATLMGALAVYEELGQQPEMVYRQLYDVEIKQTKTTKELCLKVLAPEHCKVGEDTPDFTLEDCNYFEYCPDDVKISDLRALGYDVPDDIASDSDYDTEEEDARDGELANYQNFETPDKSMREVTARWIWIRHDANEDGIAELQHVLLVGETILEHYEVSTIPVACIVPFMNTHRHIGNSVADLLFDIQRIKTKLLRSGLDSTELSTRPRHIISKEVNLNDMLKSPPGGVVRLRNGVPGEGHALPLQTEFVLPQALEAINHMDTVVESRVGVNRMFQGIDSSNLNDHNRIGQLSTMAAQRVEDIARIFGEGFKRLFSICHELMIKSGHSGQALRIRGEWVDIDPTVWSTGRDMRVTAPFAAGNKDALVQRLMIHLNIHREALASGAPFVDANDTYNLLEMLSDATDVPGSKIYTDPATVEPPPPQPDPTMIALEIENKKADNEAADEARKSELDRYKADLDAQLAQYKADLDSQDKRYATDVQSETQLRIAAANAEMKGADLASRNAQAEASRKDAKEKVQQPKDNTKGLERKLDKIAKDLKESKSRARTIIRDDKDRIVGIE